MSQSYAMCPCCGRSIIVGEEVGDQKSLFHEDRQAAAEKQGGEVWTVRTRGLGRGMGFENVPDDAPHDLVERVLSTLAKRCRRFLEWYDDRN